MAKPVASICDDTSVVWGLDYPQSVENIPAVG